jgi:carbamoyltransferase
MRILAISPNHDASLCVINDGKIELYLKEERLSRIKRDCDLFLSLIEVFNQIKSPIDLCVIASNDDEQICEKYHDLISKLFKCRIEYMGDCHHKQHAALAFENSNFDGALVFVIDRNGSVYYNNNLPIFRESETVFICKKTSYSIKNLYKNFWAFNLGNTSSGEVKNKINDLKINNPFCTYVCRSSFNVTKVYETATTLISQHPLENGKTMGLSAYGNPIDFPKLFIDPLNSNQHLIPNDSYLTHLKKPFSQLMCSAFADLDCMATSIVSKDKHQLYSDYAKHVQNETQNQVTKFIQNFVTSTGIKNVVITGGYGMNIVSNSHYVKNLPDVNFYFEPMADDSGNSIGAGIYHYKTKSNDFNNYKLENTFFHGYEYPLNSVVGHSCTTDDIVEFLNNQKTVAVYHGLAESGQRALGNRSILFDALNPKAKDIVNIIKKREWYRPFAAIVLEEDANIYFDMLGLEKNECMTNSFQVRKKYKKLLGGIIHVDGSCRIQTIDKKSHLYELIVKIKNKNDHGILLNTSFNLAGEALVETPEQAIDTLNKSDIDYLWFPKISKYVI